MAVLHHKILSLNIPRKGCLSLFYVGKSQHDAVNLEQLTVRGKTHTHTKKKQGLTCNIYKFPLCNYSHSGQFQAINVTLLNLALERDEYKLV